MVSYYNPLAYTQKHTASNLNYPAAQPWQWPTNYPTTNHQLLTDLETSHSHHQVYYNPHHMFHSPGNSSSEWHSPLSASENLLQSAPNVQQIVNDSNNLAVIGSSTNLGPSSNSLGPTISEMSSLNESRRSINDHHIADSLPSPSLTISANSVRSPEVPSTRSPRHISNSSNNSTSITNVAYNNQTSPSKAQYYEWMKKPSYPAQPAPGKTRTKDKYRVVYTDFQRLELEKEYCTSRYITIRRKTELAQILSLSERQVKIWFQNRRAKERKQNKKNADPTSLPNVVSHCDHSIAAKTKMEPSLHLQHTLHSMTTISMPSMGLHHMSHHHPFAVTAAPPHQLHSQHAQVSTSVASVSSMAL